MKIFQKEWENIGKRNFNTAPVILHISEKVQRISSGKTDRIHERSTKPNISYLQFALSLI